MRVWLLRKRIGVALVGVALVAACSTNSSNQTASTLSPTPTAAGLVPVTVQVDPDLAQAPFDQPRQALVPAGWTLSVWARVPKARLAAWAPDGSLLVSVPSSGQVVRLEPSGAGTRLSVPLDGLDQPHGLAFSGNTLYIAESDQVDAYDYADGAATNRRTVAAGLPDARSPDLGGAYAHALKSVAVGPDGAVYFSIGSTGNITADDRDGEPAARHHHADPARRRARSAVRDRRAQRDGSGDRARRFGVDRGQQPRQRRKPAISRSHP